jgi:hypothetical protein
MQVRIIHCSINGFVVVADDAPIAPLDMLDDEDILGYFDTEAEAEQWMKEEGCYESRATDPPTRCRRLEALVAYLGPAL